MLADYCSIAIISTLKCRGLVNETNMMKQHAALSII